MDLKLFLTIVAAVVIGAGAGIFLGIAIRKNTAEKEIGDHSAIRVRLFPYERRNI